MYFDQPQQNPMFLGGLAGLQGVVNPQYNQLQPQMTLDAPMPQDPLSYGLNPQVVTQGGRMLQANNTTPQTVIPQGQSFDDRGAMLTNIGTGRYDYVGDRVDDATKNFLDPRVVLEGGRVLQPNNINEQTLMKEGSPIEGRGAMLAAYMKKNPQMAGRGAMPAAYMKKNPQMAASQILRGRGRQEPAQNNSLDPAMARLGSIRGLTI